MKSKILWGIFLIFIGLVVLANSLGFDINIFFKGWWTLFIIVPSFIGLFSEESKLSNIIWLGIGAGLLLVCQDVTTFDYIIKLLIPFILIVIGLSIIFNSSKKEKVNVKFKDTNDLPYITATFSSIKETKDEFEGANVDAIFGGVILDLREAKLDKETMIKASAIFGGITILVPTDVKVVVASTPIFGGVSNRCKRDSKKTIYVDALSMFGGIEIK